ncbi:hypothetical protein LINPERHAP2_LOCUS7407 [Linum perenne]
MNGGATVAPRPVGSKSARQQRLSFTSCSKASTRRRFSYPTSNIRRCSSTRKSSREEAEGPKPWKLRPRRGLASCSGRNLGISRNRQ